MWELVLDTLNNQIICISKLALEIQDLLLPVTVLLPRLDDEGKNYCHDLGGHVRCKDSITIKKA
jgi:hypothetical protein